MSTGVGLYRRKDENFVKGVGRYLEAMEAPGVSMHCAEKLHFPVTSRLHSVLVLIKGY